MGLEPVTFDFGGQKFNRGRYALVVPEQWGKTMNALQKFRAVGKPDCCH